ncbi:MAG: AraC family transcriptional regulator [Bdellovibrionaceae bacterium]|nr:AraC family transcriptional regulator [Bdellovibrio sp.]
MIKHTIFAIAVGMLIFALYLFQYTGAFKSVTIGTDQRGPYTVIYKDHVGAYHKIVSAIEEVEKWSRSKGLKCRLSFGEYFDDPGVVEEGRLKSRGGCLIDPLDANEIQTLAKIKSEFPAEFKTDVIAKTKAVIALFDGAPGIGPLKVYPKAADYITENKLTKKGPVIEIYEVFDSKSMQTTYLWPVAD